MSSELGLGITRGAKAIQDYNRNKDVREARNAEARLVQQRAEAQINSGLPQQQANLEVQQLKDEVNRLQAESLKRDTYTAFDKFNLDGDINHLNTFLQDARKTPLGQRLYSNIVRVDPINNSMEAQAQLGRLGVDNIEDYLAHPELKNSKIMATTRDGSQQVLDLNNLYAMTGYSSYLGAERLKQLQLRSGIDQALRGPQTAETNLIRNIAKEKNISLTQAAAEFYKLKKPASTGSGRVSAQERIADEIQAANPEMSREDALIRAKGLTTSGSALEREARRVAEETGKDYQQVYQDLKGQEDRTSKRKQLDEAVRVRSEIDQLVGGEYLGTKTDEVTRRKIGPLITELESLTGKALTTDDKKTARQLKSIFELGETASKELTDAQTGFIDSTLNSVKKYFSDDASNTEGTSAYATFSNTLRNTLFGATLTPAEIEAFRNAAGSLKQQLGPVLAGLKVQLGNVKNQLQSIYDLNDEYIAQYYLGTSLEHTDKVMDAIDQRLQLFNDIEQSAVIRATPTETKPKERPSLDSIFGAQQ